MTMYLIVPPDMKQAAEWFAAASEAHDEDDGDEWIVVAHRDCPAGKVYIFDKLPEWAEDGES